MGDWALLFALIPAFFAVMRKISRKYVYSALVTLSCLAIAACFRARGWAWLAGGFAFSVLGDYLLAHQRNRPFRFIGGVGGFFLAHACFLGYALRFFQLKWVSVASFALLGAAYAVYLAKRVLPAIDDRPLAAAVCLYAAISVCVFSAALSMCVAPVPRFLFVGGIASIIFSDTLISADRFLGDRRLKSWILPTYYLCHILLTLAYIRIGNGA